MSETSPALLELLGVSKRFVKPLDVAARLANFFSANSSAEAVQAVDNVSLRISAGEVVGLVGESGCGKSTLGRMAAGLLSLSGGVRRWKGEAVDALEAGSPQRRPLPLQMIFQDPYASLNPRLRVLDIVGEAPVVHGLVAAREQREYVANLLQQVGLDGSMLARYPHQFSGGQRARIGIARALAVQPEMLVCDEAVASLDVSIQAQIINLFLQLRHDRQLTYLFISHDLGVVRHMADRVAIMYLGRIVESAPTEELFLRAQHPYTQALQASAPRLEVKKILFMAIKGEIPSPLQPPSGCHFHPRCPHAMARCKLEQPILKEISPHHLSACHLNDLQ